LLFAPATKRQLQVDTANAILSPGQMPVLLPCGRNKSNDLCQWWKKYERGKDDRSSFLKSQTTSISWKSCSKTSSLFTGPWRRSLPALGGDDGPRFCLLAFLANECKVQVPLWIL